MGTYGVTHIKKDNEILSFSDSYDGYISSGMGESNIMAIRNMSTDLLRQLFDRFTAFDKAPQDNLASFVKNVDENLKAPNRLDIHNLKEFLLSDSNDVQKDNTFYSWLNVLNHEIRVSSQGAPIILGLNTSPHYGSDYDYSNYLIDLDNEVFKLSYLNIQIPFEDIRKMSSKQISILCGESLPEEDIQRLSATNNIPKNILESSLSNIEDLYEGEINNENHQLIAQQTLNEYIKFILNGNHDFYEKTISTQLEREKDVAQDIPSTIVESLLKHNYVSDFIEKTTPQTKGDVLKSMLVKGSITQAMYEQLAKSPLFANENMDISTIELPDESEENSFTFENSSYSISTFSLSSHNQLLEALQIIGVKNLYQQFFPNVFDELDYSLKISESSITYIDFDNCELNINFYRIIEDVLGKFPHSISSSSIIGTSYLNKNSDDAQLIDYYNESQFLTTQDFFRMQKIDKTLNKFYQDGKLHPVFAFFTISDILDDENIKKVNLSANPDISILFSLCSFNKNLFDNSINEFINHLLATPDNTEKKELYLNQVLTLEKTRDSLLRTSFQNQDFINHLNSFVDYVKNHECNQKLESILTSNEKTIFKKVKKSTP